MYTVIQASKEQAKTLLKKHIKGILLPSKIIFKHYSYDEEDEIGFVTLYTITGKIISYQLRNNIPMFVEFTEFGNIRYDISYPEKLNQELFDLLQKYGVKAQVNFWKGGQI